MNQMQLKRGYFILEGMHAYGTFFFFNYLMFLLRDEYNFGRRETLAAGAVHGLVYFLGCIYAGRFAQRFGYYTSLTLGFGVMIGGLILGAVWHVLIAQLAAFWIWTAGMCFTWPALEALASEGESSRTLPRVIGFYNLVWAGLSGAGYFTGGAIFEHLGASSVYRLPLGLLAVQLLLLAVLARAGRAKAVDAGESPNIPPDGNHEVRKTKVAPEVFLKMAWLANPFAYVAINTLLLVIPGIALELQLSTTATGIFCSLWTFTRLGAFAALWRWSGWHYRFGWLAAAYLGLILGFIVLLTARNLFALVAAQIVFGFGTGLIYYSSLFYSMDVGKTKGEHGGLHEGAIGLGVCVGPGLGAGTLYLFPQHPQAGIWAVAGLLCCGLVALLWMRYRR